ncbi:MAG: DnaJ domain-containing protein, partial [Alphaproteobacteria bacterium]
RTGERQTPSNYARLGLPEGAAFDQVKEAYVRLARKYHPDYNPNQTGEDRQKFQEITAAYNVLKGQRDGVSSRDDVQGAASQGSTSDTTRQLSGTTVAPMPRGDTGDGRAAQESSRRDSIADARENLEKDRASLEDNYNYPSYQKDGDNDSDKVEDRTSSSNSPHKKEKEEPANKIVSARGLRDNNKKSDSYKEGMKRAASVAGDGVSAHEIIAMVGYEADIGQMRKAKEEIVSKRTIVLSRK